MNILQNCFLDHGTSRLHVNITAPIQLLKSIYKCIESLEYITIIDVLSKRLQGTSAF